MVLHKYNPRRGIIALLAVIVVVFLAGEAPALAQACSVYNTQWDANNAYVMTSTTDTDRYTELYDGIICANAYTGTGARPLTIRMNDNISIQDSFLNAVSGIGGQNAFPIIVEHIRIEGANNTITRVEPTPPTTPESYRFFQINDPVGVGDVGNLELDSLTLDNGFIEFINIDSAGGAIYVDNSVDDTTELTISNTTFANNETEGGSVGGGAIYADDGIVEITDSTFNTNNAGQGAFNESGGAIYFLSFGNTAELTISGTDFTSNTATSNGAAIFIDDPDTVTISNSQFSSNVAADSGGAIYQASGNGQMALNTVTFNANQSNGTGAFDGGGAVFTERPLTVTNGSMTNNQSQGDGGALYTLEQATIDGTTISSNTSVNEGGAIRNSGTLTINNATIDGNTTTDNDGGGIYSSFSTVTIDNTDITANSATTGDGGGIYTDNDTLTITNTLIDNNSADDASGGGIDFDQTIAEISDTTISNNSTGTDTFFDNGGGLRLVDDSDVTLRNVTINDNETGGTGGGIFTSEGSILTVVNSSIIDNTANIGGAIGDRDLGGGADEINIANTIMTGNEAVLSTNAGGILMPATGETVTIVNTLIADSTGSGIVFGNTGSTDTTVTITNSTIANNSNDGIDFFASTGPTITLNNSIVSLNTNDDLGDPSLVTDNNSLVGGTPGFTNAAGGDYTLAMGSPAIDAGSNALVPLDTFDVDDDTITTENLPIDLDGNDRVQDLVVDQGAYETGETIVIVFPIAPTCDASLTVTEGNVGIANLSATDADGIVNGATINSGGVSGISIANLTPATTTGGTLTADLRVDATVPAGTYNVEVLFTNNQEQTATCTVAVTVERTSSPPPGDDPAPPAEELLQQVTELPATGETPWWRNWVLIAVLLGGGALSTLGIARLLRR